MDTVVTGWSDWTSGEDVRDKPFIVTVMSVSHLGSAGLPANVSTMHTTAVANKLTTVSSDIQRYLSV